MYYTSYTKFSLLNLLVVTNTIFKTHTLLFLFNFFPHCALISMLTHRWCSWEFFLTTLCRGQDSNLRKRVAPFLRDLSKVPIQTELPDRLHTLLILTNDLNSLACIRPRSFAFWEVIQFSAFGQLSSEPKSGRRFPWKAEQCERGKKVENGHSVFFVRPGNETDSRHPLKKLFSF